MDWRQGRQNFALKGFSSGHCIVDLLTFYFSESLSYASELLIRKMQKTEEALALLCTGRRKNSHASVVVQKEATESLDGARRLLQVGKP